MQSTDVITKQQHDEELQRLRKRYSPNNLFNVPVSSSLEFFKRWCIFMRPFVSLTDKECDIIASFLNQRWLLSQQVQDATLLDSMLNTKEVREKVIADSHVTQSHFYVVMGSLRKKGIIVNNKIAAQLIPNIRMDDNGLFKLMVLFKLN